MNIFYNIIITTNSKTSQIIMQSDFDDDDDTEEEYEEDEDETNDGDSIAVGTKLSPFYCSIPVLYVEVYGYITMNHGVHLLLLIAATAAAAVMMIIIYTDPTCDEL